MIEFTKATLKKDSFFEYEATNQKIYIPLPFLKQCVFEQEHGCWWIQYPTHAREGKASWKVIENPMDFLDGKE